mgnify:CR=1 FL=1
MTTNDIAVKHYACSYCGARAGERCRFTSGVTKGRLAGRPHTARVRGVNRAWVEGFIQGRRDALDLIDLHGPDKAVKSWLS